MLLVGNDSECARLIGHTLREMGLTSDFHTAPDGPSALAHLRQHGVPSSWVIVLDLEMPDGTAFAFLETVKADAALRIIPIVVLAAGEDVTTIATCYNLGAAGYLVKTDANPSFAEKIKRACGYWMLSRVPAV